MSNITNLLIALAFVLIGIVFLISYFVTRAKVAKWMRQTLEGRSADSKNDSKAIIESTKKLVWHLGIAYVTIALSLFFEGLSGVITSTVVTVLFVIVGVLLFVYGVFMTAYGVLALYNENEQKYGKMEKAQLATVCKLSDGKQLLVFVPDGSFGASTLNEVAQLSDNELASYRSAGGSLLDCCVVDDAKGFEKGNEYLLYVSTLRVKYAGVNVSFITENGVEASISPEKPIKKAEAKKSVKAEEDKTEIQPQEAKKSPKAKKSAETKSKKAEKQTKKQK